MRALIAINAILLFLLANGASAFSGPEHRDATEIAIRVALQATKDDPSVSPAMREIAERLLVAGPEGYALADVTVAVDWFQGPGILSDETIAFRYMAQRKRQLIWKLLAAHEDREHFQKAALDSYAAFHDRALDSSRRGKFARALFSEAVALHYLEDFLAAGHVVTPRTGFHDVVSASLHDRYNSKGVKALVPNREAWKPLLDAMVAIVPQQFSTVCLSQADVDAFRLSSSETIPMRGDDHLQTNIEQKVLLILLAARSMQEVLESSNAPTTEYLRPCYEPRSGRGSGKFPDHQSIQNVTGGFELVKGDVAWPRVLGGCNAPGGVKLLEYMLKEDKDLTLPFLDVPGVELILSTGWSPDLKQRQQVVDIGRILLTRDPNHSVHIRSNDDDHITPNTFSSPLPLEYGSVHVSLLRGDGYKAIGLVEELAYHVGGTTTSLLFGVRRYSQRDLRQYRFDSGAKVAFGFQVINVNVTIERAHRYTSEGAVRPQVFVSPGLDIQLSGSWLRAGGTKTVKWVKKRFGRPVPEPTCGTSD